MLLNRMAAWSALLLAVLVHPSLAIGGQTAENVIVVVNADSAESRTLANHYIHLREVPSGNVVFLSEVPTELTCTLEDFRSKILRPLIEELNRRKLAPQANVIAYSAGFPTSVNVGEHTKRMTDENIKKYQLPTASLTGLTYFYQFVLADNEGYLNWSSNLYSRGAFDRNFASPFSKGEDQEAFLAAEKFAEEERYTEAARGFADLYRKHPRQSPLAIRSAEYYVRSDDKMAAIEMLQLAISTGWQSKKYLEDNEFLATLLDEESLAAYVSLLQSFPTVSQYPQEFSAATTWAPNGWPATSDQGGVRYLASCMLAVIHPRGNTLEQAIEILKPAAMCDRTYPKAAIWFTSTADVRTKTRFGEIPKALLWLGKLNQQAGITRGRIPSEPDDVVGLMLGAADSRLAGKTWKFVPGAISENLTSLSAAFSTDAQTKITELLQNGAAMSCGPVTEPFTIPYKFPTPLMYGYYASGATAIEAFYSSIASPYQTLIVGDPLAAPFSRPPGGRVAFSSDPEGARFRIAWQPSLVSDKRLAAAAIQLYVRGRLVRQAPPLRRMDVGLNKAPQGKLDVRVVLVGRDGLHPRIAFRDTIDVGDASTFPRLVQQDTSVELSCEGASRIELFHHQQSLGAVEGSQGSISLASETVNATKLGEGPLRVRAVATVNEKPVFGPWTVISMTSP